MYVDFPYSHINARIAVTTGGMLFEMYLDGMSSWSAHKMWKKIKGSVGARGVPLDIGEQDYLIRSERGEFHGFVIKSCANIGNNGKRQLFFPTFVARYHGLSRMGSQMMSHYGFNMTKSNYDKVLQEVLKSSDELTRYAK